MRDSPRENVRMSRWTLCVLLCVSIPACAKGMSLPRDLDRDGAARRDGGPALGPIDASACDGCAAPTDPDCDPRCGTDAGVSTAGDASVAPADTGAAPADAAPSPGDAGADAEPCAGRPWEVEVVPTMAPVELGRGIGLAVDARGGAHVAVVVDSDGPASPYVTLRYGYRSPSGEWRFEDVTSATSSMASLSVALDATSRVHVAWMVGGGGVRHAVRDARGAWTIESVGDADGGAPVLTAGADGALHLAFLTYAGAEPRPRYARRASDAEPWVIESIDDPRFRSTYAPGMALDAAGEPHLCYTTSTTLPGDPFELHYARHRGGAWEVRSLGVATFGSYRCSLALAASGEAHLIFADVDGGISHAHGVDGTWQTSSIASDPRGLGAHVRVEPETGVLHVVYESGSALHAGTRRLAGEWRWELVTDEPHQGYDTALALDPAGLPRVAFLDDPGVPGQARYAAAGACP